MPAVLEAPPVETPSIAQDGGFAERLGQTIQTDPNAARLPGFGAPKEPEKVIPPEPKQEVKVDPPAPKDPVLEKKPGASEMLKQLAAGEKKEPADKTVPPPTAEQKKEYTMKELRLRAERADALEKEVAEHKAKISEFETKYKDIDPETIKKTMEEKDKTLAEREDKIAALNLMESTKFKKAVSEPLETYKSDIKARSEKFKFSWRDFENVLLTVSDPDEQLAQIDKILDEAETPLTTSQRANIVARVQDINATSFYGAGLLRDAGKAQESLKAEEARKANEEKESKSQSFKSQSDTVFNQMFSEEMLADMPFLAPKGEDGKPVADKTLLDGIRKAAVADKAPWRLALDSYSAEVLPLVMDYAKERDAKIAELEDRIGKLSGAGPKGGGEIRHEESGGQDAGLSLQEKVEKVMKAQGRM